MKPEILRYKVIKRLGYLSTQTALLSAQKPIRTTEVIEQKHGARQLDNFPALDVDVQL